MAIDRPEGDSSWRRSTARDEEAVHEDGVAVAKFGPLPNQEAHDRAHLQDFPCHERAALIPVDLVAHDRLRRDHAEPQCSDLFADLTDTIVHGCVSLLDESHKNKL